MKKVLLALAIASAAPLAFANAYIGGSYSRLDFKETGIENGVVGTASDDFRLNSLALTGGYQFTDILAAEVRVGFGIGDDTRHVRDRLRTVKLRNYVGAYAKAGFPFGKIYPYALAGFTRADYRHTGLITVANNSESRSETDVSYGVGVAYNFSDSLSMNIEYASLVDKKDVRLRGFNIGANFHF